MAALEAAVEVFPPSPLPAATRRGDILDEGTRKDLFTDTFCKVCRAVLQFESHRMSHYKVNGSEVVDKNKYCNLCNMVFSSPVVALSHYLGKIHAKKRKQLSGVQVHMPAQSMQPVPALQKPLAEKPLLPLKAEESSSSSNSKLNLNDPEKYCRLCCAPFNNPVTAHQHYVGKKHRRNEARKKLLEELGDKAIPAESSTSAIGAGYYLCPVCDITLTSIETYQSHMQGSKHRNKETVLASLRKKSNKTNYSFQDELTDHIEAQKAGDLQPGRSLGKAGEEEFKDKNIEGGSNRGEVLSSDFNCAEVQHYSLFSATQWSITSGENRSPSWPSAGDHALEKTLSCHDNKRLCKVEQASEMATIREKSFSLLVAQSEGCYKLRLAETFTNSYKKEEKFQIEHFEEEKYASEELKYEKGTTRQKRKTNSEGANFGKENEKQKRIKVEIGLGKENKSRPYKDISLKENPAEKENKKPQNGKMKSQTNVKREEELLWDESVLGY